MKSCAHHLLQVEWSIFVSGENSVPAHCRLITPKFHSQQLADTSSGFPHVLLLLLLVIIDKNFSIVSYVFILYFCKRKLKN